MSLRIAAMVLAGAALAATASAQDLANMGVPEFGAAPAQPHPAEAAAETPAPAADEATTEKERKAREKREKAAAKKAAEPKS